MSLGLARSSCSGECTCANPCSHLFSFDPSGKLQPSLQSSDHILLSYKQIELNMGFEVLGMHIILMRLWSLGQFFNHGSVLLQNFLGLIQLLYNIFCTSLMFWEGEWQGPIGNNYCFSREAPLAKVEIISSHRASAGESESDSQPPEGMPGLGVDGLTEHVGRMGIWDYSNPQRLELFLIHILKIMTVILHLSFHVQTDHRDDLAKLQAHQ